jgi:hypothetical protein
MSRLFLAGVLAVLLGLLGVMANLVSPKAKGPDPAEAAKVEAAQKQKQEDQMSKQQQAMKDMMKQHSSAKASPEGNGHLPSRPKSPTPSPNKGMQVTSDWFVSRPDGAAGIKKLADEDKKEQQATPMLTQPVGNKQ